ncbi:MAG: amidohydrolase [Chloroflexi bacterium]|nr:amidohydrolase [Chloroflexota bacterium]
MADILIKNAIVITMDGERRILRDGAIRIEGNRIVEIGSTGDLERKHAANKVIDGARKVVMPGLVNAHTHLCYAFGRTLGYDNYLLDWLKIQKPLTAAFTPEDWEIAETLGCVENIKNGATCVNELNIAAQEAYEESVDERCLKSFEKTGVRAVLSRGYQDDKTYYFAAFGESREDIVARMERLVREWHGAAGDRIRIQLAPVTPWTCSPELFRETRRMADKHGIGIHLHTAETRDYDKLVKERFGYAGNVEYLDDVGCLGPDVQLNHAVWLSDADLARIAATGTHCIHNPTSNMILASGVSPVPKMFALGINVGLACDGMACNNNQDMISTMKFASLLHKVHNLDPRAITAQQVMEMATINGARALGLDKDIGSLEPGKKADLITIDLWKPHLVATLDVVGAVVYSANGSDVCDVIVDGEVIMEDRVIKTVDEADLLERTQRAAEDCLKRVGFTHLMVPQ